MIAPCAVSQEEAVEVGPSVGGGGNVGPPDDNFGSDDGDDASEPPGPSPVEQWRDMAAAGDIRGLLTALAQRSILALPTREILERLQQAIDTAVRSDPAAFTQLVAAEMLAAVGGLTLRGNLYLRELTSDLDSVYQHRRRWSPSKELDEFLPKLMSLQKHYIEIARLSASAQRLTELAQAHRLANKETARRRRRRAHRRKQKRSRFGGIGGEAEHGGDN